MGARRGTAVFCNSDRVLFSFFFSCPGTSNFVFGAAVIFQADRAPDAVMRAPRYKRGPTCVYVFVRGCVKINAAQLRLPQFGPYCLQPAETSLKFGDLFFFFLVKTLITRGGLLLKSGPFSSVRCRWICDWTLYSCYSKWVTIVVAKARLVNRLCKGLTTIVQTVKLVLLALLRL